MSKPFEKPSVMKLKARKHFEGNKKLKNIKMFEEFSMNEAQSDAVASRKLQTSKKFADEVAIMIAASQDFAKMKKKLDEKGALLSKMEGSVQKTLEEYGAVFLEIDSAAGKIALELKKKDGKESKSYKSIAEAVEELLPQTKEIIKKTKAIHDKFTKINPGKTELEYSVQEGLVDVLKSIGGWFKSAWKGLKDMLPSFKKSATKLTNAVDAL